MTEKTLTVIFQGVSKVPTGSKSCDFVRNISSVITCPQGHNVGKDDGRTSVVTSLMKGKMALTFVAEDANCKHSAKKSCLQGWALRCNLLQMNTRSLQEAADDKCETSDPAGMFYLAITVLTHQVNEHRA